MGTTGVTMERQIPLLDLRAQHQQIREEVLAELVRVIDSQRFILGEAVEKLEQAIADYCCTRFAIGCGSGSDAVFLALRALEIQPGDEVLTTPYTFFATVGSICLAGATPVFVDVEETTYNMNMDQAVELLARRPKIRAVIPIHLFGGCADMDPLCACAKDRGIAIIEDAAQSIGAEYKGRRAGSMGDIGCFSFFPSKNLGGYGEGGMVVTNDAALAERLRALRVHGSRRKYYHDLIGVNSRLDTLQAAVLKVKLKYLDGWSAGRARNADIYRRMFEDLRVPAGLPRAAVYQTRHIYNQFTIREARRDQLQAHLKSQGSGSEIYYPLPLHLQACFAYLGYKEGDFSVSERLAKESLSLPIYPELPPDALEYVGHAAASFYCPPQV